MLGDGTEGSGLHDRGRKLLNKHNWRGRFFSPDAVSAKDRDEEEKKRAMAEDVVSFLRPGRADSGYENSSEDLSSQLNQSQSKGRWPAVADLTSPTSPVARRSADSRRGVSSPRDGSYKPRRGPPLSVKFAEGYPLIIGEGGEESETPTVEISRRWARSGTASRDETSRSRTNTMPAERSLPPTNPLPHLPTPGSNRPLRSPLINTSQPRSDQPIPSNEPDNRQDMINSSGSSPARSGSISRIDRPGSAMLTPAARIQAKRMQAEEGAAFHSARSPDFKAQLPVFDFESAQQPLMNSANSSPQVGKPSRTGTGDSVAFLSLQPKPSTSRTAPKSEQRVPTRGDGVSEEPAPPRRVELVTQETALPERIRPSQPSPPQDHTRAYDPCLEDPDEGYTATNEMEEPQEEEKTLSPLEVFSIRSRPLASLFGLSSEAARPMETVTLREWVRCAYWWFINGRADFHLAMRRMAADKSHQYERPMLNPQFRKSFVDIAKAWWIIDVIALQHSEISSFQRNAQGSLIDSVISTGEQTLIDTVQAWDNLREAFDDLATSMQLSGVLDGEDNEITLVQGADTIIWMKIPKLEPQTYDVVSNSNGLLSSLHDLFPLNESAHQTYYGRMLVEAVITEQMPNSTRHRSLCLFSLCRAKKGPQITAALSSQSPLVSLIIQDDRSIGPAWKDIKWHATNRVLSVKTPHGATVDICFGETDFRKLREVFDRPTEIDKFMEPKQNEVVAFEAIAMSVQQRGGLKTNKSFAKPDTHCRVRLFEVLELQHEGAGEGPMHRCFRLAVVSNPNAPSYGYIDCAIGHRQVIEFAYLRSETNDPGILIATSPTTEVILTFVEESDRSQLLMLLNGQALRKGEKVFKELQLRSMSIGLKNLDEVSQEPTNDYLWSQKWLRFSIIDVDPSVAFNSSEGPPDSKRLVGDFGAGTMTDRISSGPGAVFIALSPVRQNELCVVRPRQDNMTITASKSQISPDMLGCVKYALQNVSSLETMRKYSFVALQDLHFFQLAMTGFAVGFDSVIPQFSITRRRMVVPIHKKWEAVSVRIQVVKHGANMQLLVFFQNFIQGHCMSVPLKGTDTYESFDKAGKYHTRIVEARFALPKNAEAENRTFLSLDNPEYASEQDDIVLTFESDIGKPFFLKLSY
jgi:hypothetical protein